MKKAHFQGSHGRVVVILLFLAVCTGFIHAQPASVSEADFSESRISIAGPDRLFMRGVLFDGESYSLLLKARADDGSSWEITNLYKENENLAPPTMVTDLVNVLPEGDNIVKMSGIIVDGTSYSASFTITPEGILNIVSPLHESPLEQASLDKLGSVKDLLMDAAEEKYEARITQLIEQTDSQKEEIDVLTRENELKDLKIGELSSDNAVKTTRIDELTRENSTQKESIDQLSGEIESVRAENSDLEQRLNDAENTTHVAESGGISETAPDDGLRINDFTWGSPILSGFAGSTPQIGNWRVTDRTAKQLDGSHYFARLILPIEQTSQPTLYSFKTRAAGPGWVGTGVHIFATDEKKLPRYGFGNSLLVWITRDPWYYGDNETRIQLYRSDPQVQMEMVLDAVIQEPISDFMDVTILYEPGEEYITLAVNGVEKVRYKTWFSVDSGIDMALRTLGAGVEFADLTVQTAR